MLCCAAFPWCLGNKAWWGPFPFGWRGARSQSLRGTTQAPGCNSCGSPSVSHQPSHGAPWIRAFSKGTTGANRQSWSGRICKTISCNIYLFWHRTLGCRDIFPSFLSRFQHSNSIVFPQSCSFSWLRRAIWPLDPNSGSIIRTAGSKPSISTVVI